MQKGSTGHEENDEVMPNGSATLSLLKVGGHSPHVGTEPQLTRKDETYTLGQKSSIKPKIHTLKMPLFTKFTISKSYYSQNSLF